MAAGSKIVIQYATTGGENVNHTWNYANPAVSNAAVQALTQTTIASAEIFDKVPVLAKSAKIVTTTESEIDLNE